MFQEGVKKTIFPALQAHKNSPNSIRGQRKFIRTLTNSLPPNLPCPPRQRHAGRWQATTHTASDAVNMTYLWHWIPSLTLEKFQVIVNSLFRDLCNYPSRHMCAISLPPIFSFGNNFSKNPTIQYISRFSTRVL